jgi:hypothetical protein
VNAIVINVADLHEALKGGSKEQENVALLYGDRWHPMDNEHEEPKELFRVTAQKVKDGKPLVAVAHTHRFSTQWEPSYDDVKKLPQGLIGIVYQPDAHRVTVFDHTGYLTHAAVTKDNTILEMTW